MKILLTGGAGYIGSHTIIELYKAGHSVVVVDNLVNSNQEALRRVSKIIGKEFPFEKADIRDREAHILILCILLQSQVWTNRTSLSRAIQEPACWRLGLFPHTASVYPSKPTQASSGHLPSRIQMEQLA